MTDSELIVLLRREAAASADADRVTRLGWAAMIVELGVHDFVRSQMSRLLGSRGGTIGGKARMAKLTPAERTRHALRMARARWDRT